MMIQAVRPARKHLALLTGLIAMLVAQPLLAHRSVAAGAFFDAVLSAICLYVFFIVFGERWQRRVAIVLLLPAFIGNCLVYVSPRAAHILPEVLFHCSMIAFLGFAVVVILRDILRKNVIHGDDVVGALCGYILVALVWASLYTLTYLLVPSSFSVSPDIAARLGEWHQRRALFDYLSFTTLMTLGYSDITPIGPPAYTLTWLEVMAGQFYMAVVVAQLVGLKLAQALRGGGPEAK
jgi:voltage-gated potassium channel